LTPRGSARILVGMKRIALMFALVGSVVVVGLAQPSKAEAGWCWPNCSTYGLLGSFTSNNCWYRTAVCSGWMYWVLNGETKRCYPSCDGSGYTPGQILYGFENSDRIRGRFTVSSGLRYISPAEVGMGGYLRSQVTWWTGAASELNVAAIG
jgi:hypothetical protein